MIFDTHSHCYWDTLEPRIDEIVSNMEKMGVTKAVQIGCDIESSKKAISLTRRFPWVFYATVWLHPETAQDLSCHSDEGRICPENFESNEQILRASGWQERKGNNSIEELEKMIIENRDIVVAIGETGFDHHYLDGSDGGKVWVDMANLSPKAREQIENQKHWWLAQWELAKKYDLPLVIHTRDARDATLEFMKKNTINRCVMHCFSEDWEFARELLDFSNEIYFSFSGILTYKNALKIQEAASKISLNRILIETDSPFLSPQAVRGTINEPANTTYVLDKLVELRREWREEIKKRVYENSLRFYGLD